MKKKWIFDIWRSREEINIQGIKEKTYERERKTSQILFELDRDNTYVKFKVGKEEGFIAISDIVGAWIQGR